MKYLSLLTACLSLTACEAIIGDLHDRTSSTAETEAEGGTAEASSLTEASFSETSAPDALPEAGGAESGDAGSIWNDSGSDAMGQGGDSGGSQTDAATTQDSGSQQDSGSPTDSATQQDAATPCGTPIFQCAGYPVTPPEQFCETTSTGTGVGPPPAACTTCSTYNCTCFMAAFQAGGTIVCTDYLYMSCDDSNGQVRITCTN